MLIDSHCHLHDAAFADDIEAVLERARQAGIDRIVTVGTSIAESRAAIALADKHESVFATVGIAPHDDVPFTAETLNVLRGLAQHPRVVALGEFGLDYHYDTLPRETQRRVCEQQLALAAEMDMPVVIHNRDADADMLVLLARFAAQRLSIGHPLPGPGTRHPALGVMHCFSSTLTMARKCVALGFKISIAGPLTYTKPRALPEVVRALPLDALLVETDAPYLAPQAQRGRRNEPAYVLAVAEKIAELKGESLDVVAGATARNAQDLFGLGNVQAAAGSMT
jgi:TatD DNase family protein